MEHKKSFIIALDVGYGHLRAAYALKHLALGGEIINASNYPGITEKSRKIWDKTRRFYQFLVGFRKIPFVGDFVYAFFDKRQAAPDFYPKRDMSELNPQIKEIISLIKNGWDKYLIEKLKEKSAPLISTFFTPALMADFFRYPGEIYCIICDTDISRSWAPINPKKSKIKYFAPTSRAVERLKLYGVNPENIFLTGFPLPLENIGGEELEIVKEDLKYRLLNLDPQNKYLRQYEPLIKKFLGELPKKANHPLRLMFATGGAGAQKEIGIKIVESLSNKIKANEMEIVLVAGIREEVEKYFIDNIERIGLTDYLNRNIKIIFERNFENYFQEFNQALRKTDILWTKPSELSFYTALGLPIIIAPTIGSQEEFNKRWLLESGFGILQENPEYTNQWLFDLLNAGFFAKAAMQGFIEGEKLGTLKIKKIIYPFASGQVK